MRLIQRPHNRTHITTDLFMWGDTVQWPFLANFFTIIKGDTSWKKNKTTRRNISLTAGSFWLPVWLPLNDVILFHWWCWHSSYEIVSFSLFGVNCVWVEVIICSNIVFTWIGWHFAHILLCSLTLTFGFSMEIQHLWISLVVYCFWKTFLWKLVQSAVTASYILATLSCFIITWRQQS